MSFDGKRVLSSGLAGMKQDSWLQSQSLRRRLAARQEALDFGRGVEMRSTLPNGFPDESGSALGFFEDLDQILANDGNGEHIEAAKEQDENDDGGDAMRYSRAT